MIHTAFIHSYRSFCSNSPGGEDGFPFISRIWLGVRGSRSFGSSVSLVMGWSFSIASSVPMDILLTMSDVLRHSAPELLLFPCKGPLITQPRAVLKAYGPSPLLLTTSQGSNILGALLPINRSTFAIMLGILMFAR